MTLENEFVEEIEQAVADMAEPDAVAEEPVEEQASESSKPTDEPTDVPADEPPEEPSNGEPAGELADDTADEPTDEPVEEPAARPEISDAALTAAVQAGLTIPEARSFMSEDALLSVVSRMRDLTTPSLPEQQHPVAQMDDPLADLPTLDPEVYGEEAIKMFGALTDVVRQQQQQINSFHEYRENATQASQEAAAREGVQWFDQGIKDLGEDFAETLGVGDYGSLPQGSSQLAKRDAIASQIAVLLAGSQATGQPAPSRDETFRAAARLVLADEYKALDEKSLSEGLAKRAKQHVQRPGGKQHKQPKDPLDETAALLDERYG